MTLGNDSPLELTDEFVSTMQTGGVKLVSVSPLWIVGRHLMRPVGSGQLTYVIDLCELHRHMDTPPGVVVHVDLPKDDRWMKAVNIVNVDACFNQCGITASMMAASLGDCRMLQKFIQCGANVNRKQKNGTTALIEAAAEGHVTCVTALLKAGADVDLQNELGHTALTVAASRGLMDVVEMLIKAGAKVNHMTRMRYTSMMLAAANGHLAMVGYLMDVTDVDIIVGDRHGHTAVDWAQKSSPRLAAALCIHLGVQDKLKVFVKERCKSVLQRTRWAQSHLTLLQIIPLLLMFKQVRRFMLHDEAIFHNLTSTKFVISQIQNPSVKLLEKFRLRLEPWLVALTCSMMYRETRAYVQFFRSDSSRWFIHNIRPLSKDLSCECFVDSMMVVLMALDVGRHWLEEEAFKNDHFVRYVAEGAGRERSMASNFVTVMQMYLDKYDLKEQTKCLSSADKHSMIPEASLKVSAVINGMKEYYPRLAELAESCMAEREATKPVDEKPNGRNSRRNNRSRNSGAASRLHNTKSDTTASYMHTRGAGAGSLNKVHSSATSRNSSTSQLAHSSSELGLNECKQDKIRILKRPKGNDGAPKDNFETGDFIRSNEKEEIAALPRDETQAACSLSHPQEKQTLGLKNSRSLAATGGANNGTSSTAHTKDDATVSPAKLAKANNRELETDGGFTSSAAGNTGSVESAIPGSSRNPTKDTANTKSATSSEETKDPVPTKAASEIDQKSHGERLCQQLQQLSVRQDGGGARATPSLPTDALDCDTVEAMLMHHTNSPNDSINDDSLLSMDKSLSPVAHGTTSSSVAHGAIPSSVAHGTKKQEKPSRDVKVSLADNRANIARACAPVATVAPVAQSTKQRSSGSEIKKNPSKLLNLFMPSIHDGDGSSFTNLTGRQGEPLKRTQRSVRWRDLLDEMCGLPNSVLKKIGPLCICDVDDRFRIGTGPFGTRVLLGVHEDGTEVAVKKILKAYAGKVESAINHVTGSGDWPNCCIPCKGVVSDLYFSYFGYELKEYSLQELVDGTFRQGELADMSRTVITDLLHALADLQERRLAHLSLKPTNILFDVDNKLSLTDVGCGTKLKGSTEQLAFCWHSKEALMAGSHMALNGKKYHPGPDTQVAGMLINYIITGGRHPYGTDFRSCEENILADRIPWAEVDDMELFSLLRHFLQPNADARLSPAEAVYHPYFWSDQQKAHFLLVVGSQPELMQRMLCPVTRRINCAQHWIGCSNWPSRVDAALMTVPLPRQYLPTVTDLLVFTVDVARLHQPLLRNLYPGGVDESSCWFLRLFPRLLVPVYEAILECDWRTRPFFAPFFRQ